MLTLLIINLEHNTINQSPIALWINFCSSSIWTQYLLIFFLLFFLGLFGIIFNYRNFLVTMLCIEIMYLGITVCFFIVNILTGDIKGQIYGLLLLIIAAAESAIGLGILIVIYKFGQSINFTDFNELRG